MTRTLRSSLFTIMACLAWTSAPAMAEETDLEFTQSFTEGNSYEQEFGIDVEFSIELPQLPGGKFSVTLKDTEKQEVKVGALSEVYDDEEDQQLPRFFVTRDRGSSFVAQLNDDEPFERTKSGGKDGLWVMDWDGEICTPNGDSWDDSIVEQAGPGLMLALYMARMGGNMDLDTFAACGCDDDACADDCADDCADECDCDCDGPTAAKLPPINFEPLLEWAASVARVGSRPLMLQAATAWEMIEDLEEDFEDMKEDLAEDGIPLELDADFRHDEQMLAARIRGTTDQLPVDAEMVEELLVSGIQILDEMFGVELTEQDLEMLASATGFADIDVSAGGAWGAEHGLHYSLSVNGSATLQILSQGQLVGSMTIKLGTHAYSLPTDVDPAEQVDLDSWVQ